TAVRLGSRESLALDPPVQRKREGQWTTLVLGESERDRETGRTIRRQDSQGGKAGRLASRRTDNVRASDQPQDRQSPRPHNPAVAAGAGGSGDRVMDRRPFLGALAAGRVFVAPRRGGRAAGGGFSGGRGGGGWGCGGARGGG